MLKGPRPPDPKLILPPLLMPVEAKPKVWRRNCSLWSLYVKVRHLLHVSHFVQFCRSIAGKETQDVTLHQEFSYLAPSSGVGECKLFNLTFSLNNLRYDGCATMYLQLKAITHSCETFVHKISIKFFTIFTYCCKRPNEPLRLSIVYSVLYY